MGGTSMSPAPAVLAASLLALGLVGVQDKGPKPPDAAVAIDHALESRWSSTQTEAAPLADDAEFLRRLSLDLRGYIPGGDEARAFLDDPFPGKRAQKVEEYLAGGAWPGLMTCWFAQILFE